MTSIQQQQWDLIGQINEDATTCTASAGTFVAMRGALDRAESLVPGGYDEEKTMPLVLCLKKANGTVLVNTFASAAPLKGDQVTCSAGTFMVADTQEDLCAMYLKCKEL